LGREIHEQRDYSEKVAEQIDEEIENFIKQASIKTREIINEKRAYLEKVAAVLLEEETIERERFVALMSEEPAETPTEAAA